MTAIAAAERGTIAPTGLERARREVEDLGRALRQAELAAGTAAEELELLRARRVARRRERDAAKADGTATAAQLRGWDTADSEAGRHEELGVSAVQRAERQVEAAQRALGEGRDRLQAAERRGRLLREGIPKLQREILRRASEYDQGERLQAQRREGLQQVRQHLEEVRRELGELTGEEAT